MAKRVQQKPRRRVGLKEMGRRGLSMLMAMIMVISLIQISAFAAGSSHTSAEQIMEGYFTPDDNNKTVTDNTTDTAARSTQGGNVTVSKTIAGTDKENEFLVTLEVQTKQKLSETVSSPDAAVTLVLDRSGSMNYCAECGNESWHDWHCKYYHFLVWENEVKDSQTRMAAAKAGAIAFVDQLLKDTPKDKENHYTAHRYISLVSFSDRDSVTLNCDWVDVTTSDGYQTFVNAVNNNGLKADGGTYLQGGLSLAESQMKKSGFLLG